MTVYTNVDKLKTVATSKSKKKRKKEKKNLKKIIAGKTEHETLDYSNKRVLLEIGFQY